MSDISHKSEKKLLKTYAGIVENNSVPLQEIPYPLLQKYVAEYLLRDRMVDFAFIDVVDAGTKRPLYDPSVQSLFSEMHMLREAYEISMAYSHQQNITDRLRALADKYHISYSTLARRRKIYMNNTSLTRILKHGTSSDTHILTEEDTKDRYRTCCLYCRDLIIYLHEKPGKISSAKIFRDIRDSAPFSCSKCPYNPDVKTATHKKSDIIPSATCRRSSEYMIKPNCEDTVCMIVNRIPEQQDALSWDGVRSWAANYHYAPAREKPKIVNEVWFSDHKQLDIIVRVKQNKDGTWVLRRPWITAIIDAASDVMVSYVLSLNPNSDCIAECFAQACAFTVDTPYHGICDYFYIDNGKDYRSKKMAGLPNTDEDTGPLYLNKDFGESGILEWFGIKVIHALKYRGRSKTIESIWRVMDREWFKDMPGYCGERPENRPYITSEWLRLKLYDNFMTFEQFADDFADRIYPQYNTFSVTRESPDELYKKLPKASSYVPTWRTLAVLKSISVERVIRSKGIKYDNGYYWNSDLAPLIEKDKDTKYRIFAFDSPFNRRISVVKGHTYICEAHLIEKLHVREQLHYKVSLHNREQQEQHRFYSHRLRQLNSVIFQTDILDNVSDTPLVDNIRYGQAIDKVKDADSATDDSLIPEELKEQAVNYADNLYKTDTDDISPGPITLAMQELGRKTRESR